MSDERENNGVEQDINNSVADSSVDSSNFMSSLDQMFDSKEEPVSSVSEETVLFTSFDKKEKESELGSGLNGEAVIDREEWDKIIAAVDAEQANKKAEEQQKQVAQNNEKLEQKADDDKGEKSVAKKAKKKKKTRRVLKAILITILTLGILCGCAVGFIVGRIIKNTPAINPSNIYDLLSENSVLLDADGNVIDNIYSGGELRTNVEYSEMPQDLIWALVCTEDKTFFTHNGFNIIRIFGAIWDTVKSLGSVRIGGTSTITQQLARNLYLTETKSAREIEGLIRKIQEAYYTVILERSLTKEQIIEAYLNTIYLGFNSDGVQAASQAYFNKDVKDLSLVECAVLATLPQSPNKYAPLKRVAVDSLTEDEIAELDIVTMSDSWIIYYNDSIETRVKLVLKNMLAQGKISQETYDNIDVHEEIRSSLNPGSTVESVEMASSYFKDYIIDEVLYDLQHELGYTEEEAEDLLYEGGLIINSTLNLTIQNIVEDVYADPANFPKISLSYVDKDKNGNICNPKSRNIMLYAYSNMFNEEDDFVLQPTEYEKLDNGDIRILKGKRLGIYKTQVGENVEIAIEFKNIFVMRDSQLYSISGGYWCIDSKYKQRDDNGNAILDADVFTDPDYEGAFTFNDDGSITLSKEFFQLRAEIIQPQSAMVIIENETGAIRAMVGGRNIVGKQLFNRATSPRQTGSSIKPLAVYSLALQKGYDNAKANLETLAENPEAENLLPVYTAATPLDDIPTNYNDALWPYNANNKFIGATYLRYAVQQSINTCAVNLFNEALSPWESITNLQNLGVTSLVTSGPTSDVYAAALALGGLTNGISPLEMCAAYATFGNYGEYNTAKCYTTITNKNGDVILSSETPAVKVYDEEVASLMLDILYSVVNGGGASKAKLSSQPAAGKTGTTTDNYDLWFCGLTPKYSATVWIGSDMNLYVNGSSSNNATKIFKLVMDEVGKLDPKGEFELKGEFVTCTIDTRTALLATEYTPEEFIRTEIFIKGTEPTEYSDPEIAVRVCSITGYLATDECEAHGCAVTRYYTPRIGGISWETLLSSYTVYEESDIQFTADGKQYFDRDTLDNYGNVITTRYWYDKYTNTYISDSGEVGDLKYLVDNKSQYLDIIPDAVNDPPEYYCYIHNHDTEQYPVSMFALDKMYDPYAWDDYDDPAVVIEDPSRDTGDNNGLVPQHNTPIGLVELIKNLIDDLVA